MTKIKQLAVQNNKNRKLGLFHSSVLNMIDMVGIGPFIVLPLVISKMGGPYFLYAWLAGALLSFFDAMIWSELGAAFPKAGGSFNFLKEGFGPKTWGLLMSFLFVWQTLIQAPLVVASGSIGFAQYLKHIVPLNWWQIKMVSGLVVIFITLLLYRKIETIGKIGTLLWVAVILTLILIISGGVWKGNFWEPVRHINDGLKGNYAFYVVLGAATIKTMYSYGGYYNICHIAGDVRNPGKNIPRSMFLAFFVIAVLYLLMNISVVSVIPWQEAQNDSSIISVFAENVFGQKAGIIMTILILWVAFASLFAVLLGYSRIPYAAAREGDFLKIFAKEHPTKDFPMVSLLFLAGLGFLFSVVFSLNQVITGVLAMRIIVQFIGQGIGLALLRKRKGTAGLPFKMPLYPLPLIIALLMWLAIFISTGISFMLAGLGTIGIGVIVYFVQARIVHKWPFESGKTELSKL